MTRARRDYCYKTNNLRSRSQLSIPVSDHAAHFSDALTNENGNDQMYWSKFMAFLRIEE